MHLRQHPGTCQHVGSAAIALATDQEKFMKVTVWFCLPLVTGVLLLNSPLFAEAPNKKAGQDQITELVSGWELRAFAMVVARTGAAEREADARRDAEVTKSRLELIACDPNDKATDSLPSHFMRVVQKQQAILHDHYVIDAAAYCSVTRLKIKFEVKAKSSK